MNREPWADALRVLAVLGVFVVNGLGYAFAPAYPLQIGPPQPIDSNAALAAHGFVVAIFMGKAWPLLSFLFGYSLCSMALTARARGLPQLTVLRKRHLKLLVIGLLHGCLLFFGDILTTYALCGLLMARWTLARPARLLVIWKRVTVLIVVLSVIYLVSALTTWFPGAHAPMSLNYERLERFGNIVGVSAFFSLNVSSYVWQQLNSIIGFLPYVVWAALAGALARRFGLLGFRRYARHFWTQHLGSVQLSLAVLLNLALAAASMHLHSQEGYTDRAMAVATLSVMCGLWLTAALLAFAMRRLHSRNRLPQWVLWLAPAGRHTLGMYVGLSALLVVTNGAFFDITLGTLPTLFALCVAWLLAVLLAKAATKRGWRGPMARWLSK